ncbi:MAG: TerB family tellurite resistance protein [Nannocystaceae bacterium]|nr:TerB family tellurite resistance protein [Myxococcales bacterium]
MPALVLYASFLGSRCVVETVSQGTFFCPDCGQAPYHLQRVRRVLTVAGVRVASLEAIGQHVECQRCRGTFRVEVLNISEEQVEAAFEAEYYRAIRRTMVLMCLADGLIARSEVNTIAAVYQSLTGATLTREDILHEIALAQEEGAEVEQYLEGIAPQLNDASKEMVIRAAYMVATSDGEFQADEQALLDRVGRALLLDQTELTNLVMKMLREQAR